MTNKKFKVAAMSMALTACVAAQPLIANAADDVDAVKNEAGDATPVQTTETTTSAPAETDKQSKPEEIKNDHAADSVDVIGDPDISVDYDHEKDKVNTSEDGSSTTTDSTGTVNRDVPKEGESTEQHPSGDGQQGSSEGGSGETETDPDGETEKKPIGKADKSETETKDTDLVLGETTTETTTTTNPDGSTTETTTTTTDATLETTTTGKGEASSETDEDLPSENVKETLDQELGGGKLTWDAKSEDKFGDYTVKAAEEDEEDGSKTFTLTKEDKTETGKMTGEDIAKLIEAGYTDNGDGTYTLTKEYTDSKGQKQTTTIKVDSSNATKTTSTTLTVTLKKEEHHEPPKDVNESTDTGDSKLENRYPDQTEVKDKNGNTLWTGSVADLLKDAKDGKVTYEKDGKTYTFTITESSEGTSSDFNFSAEDAAKLLGDGYSYNREDGKIYHTDGDKLTEVDYPQVIEKINLHIELTVSEEKKESNETVSGKPGQTVDEATKAAEKKAAEDALKDALKKAAQEAGITADLDGVLNDALAKGEISIDKAGNWEYKTNVDGVEKTFVFAYDKTTASTKQDAASDTEKDQVKKDNPDEKIDDINKNTSTGSAGVSGATITWTESGKNAYEVIKDKEFADGLDIDLKNIPSDATVEEVEGGKRYTYTDANGKTYELTYTKPTDAQLEEIKTKLLADGVTEENIKKAIENGEFTYVSWKITSPTEKDEKVTETITEDKTNLSSKASTVKINDNGDGTYTITVNGKTYENLTTNDGGKTYTSVEGKQTTTVSVKKTKLDNEQIRDLLKETYGDTVKVDENGNATYIRIVDGKEIEVTINYSDAFQTDAEVTIDTASSVTVTDHDENAAYEKIRQEIERLRNEAATRGEELFWNEENLTEKKITIDFVKEIVTAINFGSLKGQDLINFLESQKKAADAAGDSYTGKSYQDTWNDGVGGKDYTGKNKNTIGHLDLGVDSALTTIDNKTEDCILVPSDDCAAGDAKLEFVWSDSAKDLVNNTGNVKKVGLIERVTLDDEEGRGDGHYEFPRASWDNKDGYVNPVPDNAPKTSGYYRVTGTVAYGSLKDSDGKMRDFDDKDEAKRIAEEYAKAHDIDPSQITVVAVYPDQDKNSTPVYRAYLYKSNMTAYGYMTKESNTCINKSFNYTYDKHGNVTGVKYVGGYDLLLDKLTQVSEDQITGEQYNSYSFIADLFTRKKDRAGSSNDLTQSSYEYTHKVPGEDKTEGQGTGYFGKYDVSYKQSFAWKDSETQESTVKGTGKDIFYTFKKFFTDRTSGSGDASRKQGTISANYTTTSDAQVTKAVKDTHVHTESSVTYSYSYVEREELDPIIETKTVTTPGGGGGDDGGKIIEEKTPESPILPGNVELPPVQDARPDAPVLPADPVLPAVQDAHALPQTGVNWLTAIGLALSGMTLMITGAFASLTGKNARH